MPNPMQPNKPQATSDHLHLPFFDVTLLVTLLVTLMAMKVVAMATPYVSFWNECRWPSCVLRVRTLSKVAGCTQASPNVFNSKKAQLLLKSPHVWD